MKTFDLTPNELKAAFSIVKDCLYGMGGKRPADLEHDTYTWCSADTLIEAGWTKHEAAGTYGALAAKGVIQLDKEGDAMTDNAWRWLDTLWDGQQ